MLRDAKGAAGPEGNDKVNCGGEQIEVMKFSDVIVELYNKFRIYFYMQVFSRFEKREATLTTVESYSMECIRALGEPTVQEFAGMMGISAPNAAYKVNALIQKGYIEKVRSESDRREYHLRPTSRFWEYYELSSSYAKIVERRCRERFAPEELEKLEEMLTIITEELMPELEIKRFLRSPD